MHSLTNASITTKMAALLVTALYGQMASATVITLNQNDAVMDVSAWVENSATGERRTEADAHYRGSAFGISSPVKIEAYTTWPNPNSVRSVSASGELDYYNDGLNHALFADSTVGYGSNGADENDAWGTIGQQIDLQFDVTGNDASFGLRAYWLRPRWEFDFSLYDLTTGSLILEGTSPSAFEEDLSWHTRLFDEHSYSFTLSQYVAEPNQDTDGDPAFAIHFINTELSYAAVPEPSTFVLFGLGFAGLLLTKRTNLKRD